MAKAAEHCLQPLVVVGSERPGLVSNGIQTNMPGHAEPDIVHVAHRP